MAGKPAQETPLLTSHGESLKSIATPTVSAGVVARGLFIGLLGMVPLFALPTLELVEAASILAASACCFCSALLNTCVCSRSRWFEVGVALAESVSKEGFEIIVDATLPPLDARVAVFFFF